MPWEKLLHSRDLFTREVLGTKYPLNGQQVYAKPFMACTRTFRHLPLELRVVLN
jgi:hypothetical protein